VYQLLAQSVANGSDILAQQNSMIEEFRTSPRDASTEVFRLYLGLPRPEGPVDERYPNLVKALLAQTNDVIIFGKELAEHLAEHARAVAKDYGRRAPRVAGVDFRRPDKLGLLPDVKEYKDLLAALRGEGPGQAKEAAARVVPQAGQNLPSESQKSPKPDSKPSEGQ
ncbi:MAG: hypothetical protein WBZ39_01535, partial [Methylovirgula sp.]